ncbi:DUF6095 family protein [Polaribacter tangerinus]|uniref:DUF6095 family protein n=1 Tax=Polaribacter tangerinus TaxID=1920034 RepID=UPI000B4B98D4|nr:DUF6095 family protein [Polaribacter tangerinus]
MSTNYKLLGKGLRNLGILIFLLAATPLCINVSFKAMKEYKNSSNEYISYIFVIVSIILLIFTFYFAFKTIRMLLKAIFND